jgi:hypothetical protein
MRKAGTDEADVCYKPAADIAPDMLELKKKCFDDWSMTVSVVWRTGMGVGYVGNSI